MSYKLTDYKVLVFDVYGTLADWETGFIVALQPLLSRYDVSKNWTRREALTTFSSIETDLQGQYPGMLYSDLLAKAHAVLKQRLKSLSDLNTEIPTVGGDCAVLSIESKSDTSSSSVLESPLPDDEHQAFGNSIKKWPIFSDSPSALQRLSEHFKLVVLSNVDHNSFCYTHASLSTGEQPSFTNLTTYSYPTQNPEKYWHPKATPGSQTPFTVVLTAQDTGCYKPDHGMFNAALDCIASDHALLGGVSVADAKNNVLCVAQSLTHDHVPANQLGLQSVWIDRQTAVTCNELPGGVDVPKPWTWRFETLEEMANAVDEELLSSF